MEQEWYKYFRLNYECFKNGKEVNSFTYKESARAFAMEQDCDFVKFVGCDENDSVEDTEIIWENPIRENIVQEKLGLTYEYEEYWNQWKNDIMKTLRDNSNLIYNFDYDYCLESDFDQVVDFYDEIGYYIKLIKNINGLIIYQKTRDYIKQ